MHQQSLECSFGAISIAGHFDGVSHLRRAAAVGYALPAQKIPFGIKGRLYFHAGSGNDLIFGGNGKDWLDGGSDNDTLTGGRAADAFKGGSGSDTATDYTPA